MTTVEAPTSDVLDEDPQEVELEPESPAPGPIEGPQPAPVTEPVGESGAPAAPQVPSVRLARLAESSRADLVGLSAAGFGVVLPAEAVEAVLAAVEASTAGSTKRAYRSDWARFTVWAGAGGLPSLPAPPTVVAAYVTQAAAEQVSPGRFRYAPSTLTRWVSSINQVHTAAGLEAPGRAEIVRRALSGIRRIRATPPSRRAPLLLDDIRTLLLHLAGRAADWPGGVAARRDAALLLMGFAGAFRRSELVALTVGDVTLHRSDGLHVRVRRSKTDQEAAGAVRALPYGRDPVTCAPCAWTRWRELLSAATTAKPGEERREVMRVLRRQARMTVAAGEHDAEGEDQLEDEARHVCRTTRLRGPADPDAALFRAVHRTGAVGTAALTGHAVREILRRRAAAAGLPNIAQLGGHSLRAGFVTEAFRQGADAHAIMRQTGHRSHAMLEIYAREHAPLVGNAVTSLGL